ncbi:NAD-dependent epimerase/dehydratase family protein [Spiroplasma citri]|uniref:NAD-dependent epimerase/dehydratase family protein n=1 Tax=Spiroplasma citri TaxID=2133 RepID=A0AAX3SZZ8_SPICI|nr:NAD-dependent epimerase/dehydratase family protein [Spiroplasma citri]WFG96928.1 NAD-dependent epimerase/dehydratase family protein [Spiroplasma citri]WFH00826.1 NAD-dependent epimerase/dehydratase family protein [Spiroplasma citri]
MQTILESNGQIGHELAKELYNNYTKEIRLVSRKRVKINETDQVADLMNYNSTLNAIAGSEIVYFTVGLPMNAKLMEEQFPVIIQNVLKACTVNNTKLVFFDNTYMYPKTTKTQFENTPFEPKGRKSILRAQLTNRALAAMDKKEIDIVICRAPEFYGPGHTQSITNSLVFENIKRHKKIKIPITVKTLRTLIWAPDANKAMALIGNTKDAYNQTWHLPCDRSLTYKQILEIANEVTNRKLHYSIIKEWHFKFVSHFNSQVKELLEMLPRYKVYNLFNSDKFKTCFLQFKITPFEEGIKNILLPITN